MKSYKTNFIIFSIITFLGFAPAPARIIEFDSPFLSVSISQYLFSLFLTLAPFIAIKIRSKKSNYMSRSLAGIIIVITLIIGFMLTLLSAAFSGAGAKFVLVHGSLVTLIVTTSVAHLVATPHRGLIGIFSNVSMFLATFAATWSIISMFMVIINVEKTANQRPFCIAHHSSHATPVKSIAELRGFSFYTVSTGYKDSSKWYFHGVMVVANEDGDQYYNWSPSSSKFDERKRQHLLIVRIENSCTPKQNFWRTLRIF